MPNPKQPEKSASTTSRAAYLRSTERLAILAKARLYPPEKSPAHQNQDSVTPQDCWEQLISRATLVSAATWRHSKTALLSTMSDIRDRKIVGLPEILKSWASIDLTPSIESIAHASRQVILDEAARLSRDFYGEHAEPTKPDEFNTLLDALSDLKILSDALQPDPDSHSMRALLTALSKTTGLAQAILNRIELAAARIRRQKTGKKPRKFSDTEVSVDDLIAFARHICPQDEYDPLSIFSQKSISDPPHPIARLVFEASVLTGLRPIEWLDAQMQVFRIFDSFQAFDNGDFIPFTDIFDRVGDPGTYLALPSAQARLVVKNAKRTNSPAHRPTRTLILTGLPDWAMMSIFLASMIADAGVTPEQWVGMRNRINALISKIATETGFSDGLSLNDMRHMFQTRARRYFDEAEVAALMGHGSTSTNSHYGRRVRKKTSSSGSAAGGLVPKPLQADVDEIRLTNTKPSVELRANITLSGKQE